MILAQLEMAATTNEVLWPGDFACTVGQINVANTTAGSLNLRLWVVKADQTLANKHRYVYDIPIAANDRGVFTDDFDLELSDKIWVYGSGSGLVAHLFGEPA